MYAGTSVTSQRRLFSAEILVGSLPLPLYRRGDGRHFAAGVPGSAYTVRVTPLLGGRLEVIASVDGRHVLDDEPADPRRCRGVAVVGVYEFKGWRTSDEETREFTFCSPEDSVAGGSTGVIGLAAHRERQWVPVTYTATMDCAPVAAAAAGPASVSLARGTDLGTGMGAAQHDPVGRTEFTRDGSDPDKLAIGYATEDALRSMGLLVPADPDPWPGAGLTGYAKFGH